MKPQDKPCQVEAWLEALGAPGADRDYQPGHTRVLALIQAAQEQGFTFHQPKLRIRVAGTNGKGSTAHFLAQALQDNGYQVGLYTSPHILTFHERIQVNGKPVTQNDLMRLMTLVMPLALDVQASYFETATVLALMYFSQRKVDVEILEAGVGARFDATTAVPADMALLTPVGLDHQAWLGDTLEAIAYDKAYVFEGCPTKLSTKQSLEVEQVLDEVAQDMIYTPAWRMPLAMLGEHQKHNAGLAFAALQHMHTYLPDLDITKAEHSIQHALIPGRLEDVQHQGHTFILDAAHNEHAIQALLPTLKDMQRFDVIFLATREDRDLSGCVALLKSYTDKIVVMTGQKPYRYQSIKEALDKEVVTHQQGYFLILGSFLTLNEALSWFQGG